jgi:hypothetical protein
MPVLANTNASRGRPNVCDEAASEFEPVVKTLLEHKVEFIIIGGRAEQLMGSPRITHDSDVCYRRTPENIDRVIAALKQLNAKLRLPKNQTLPLDLHPTTFKNTINFTFMTDVGPLDILGIVEPIGDYDALLPRAEHHPAFDRTLATISLDDLIRVKQHIKRGKDSESMYQLLAIKRLREEGSI